ncbi:c-type cytochrome [Pedobacter yulinensis]|nr:cytochrome c [Pedobacter yulinensis]
MKTKKLTLNVVLFTAMSVGLLACSKDQAEKPQDPPPPKPDEVTAANVTYANFASNLFQTKCSGCHAPGGGGSGAWTFNGYASVQANAGRINNVTLVTMTMPRNGSLSAKEKELLKAWLDKGLPQ